MGGKLWSLAAVAFLCLLLAQRLSLSRAFYIPGVAPTEYAAGQKLDIKVTTHWLCRLLLIFAIFARKRDFCVVEI